MRRSMPAVNSSVQSKRDEVELHFWMSLELPHVASSSSYIFLGQMPVFDFGADLLCSTYDHASQGWLMFSC